MSLLPPTTPMYSSPCISGPVCPRVVLDHTAWCHDYDGEGTLVSVGGEDRPRGSEGLVERTTVV